MNPSPFILRPVVAAMQAMLLCASVALPAQAAGNEMPEAGVAANRSYDIPAGPLAETLSRFAGAAGVTLAFDGGQLNGLHSAGLRGPYSVDGGFARLLAGTGYEALPTGGKRYSLRKPPAQLPGESSLAPVTVTAREDSGSELPRAYAGGQVAKGGRLGLLGNTHFMETPFNQTSYTAEVIEDQQARSLSDLLVNEPSVRLASARSNINEDFSIRGFTVASGDVALNGMYGLMPYYRVPVEMAERVEVLKGPSSLLNGMPPSGNVGGAINIVPKRAGEEALTRLSASYLSDSIFGVHADIGRRFGEHKEFGVRFNGAYRSGDTTTDNQEQTDQVYSLGLDYRGERLRASLDLLYQNQRIDGAVRQFIAAGTLTALPKAPEASLAYPGFGYSKTQDKMIVARAEYDLTDAITIYAGLGTRRHELNALTGNPSLLNTAGDFSSSPAWQIYQVINNAYEAGADWRFATGPVGHKVAVNASRVVQDAKIDFDTFWAARSSNLYNPTYSSTPDVGSATIKLNNYNDTTLTSYALADTLSFLDDKVKLTLGARHQNVETQAYNFATGDPSGSKYDESRITPVVGLVVQPRKNLSFYGNYIEGLSKGPVAPVAGVSNPGEIFPPIKTKQIEIGAKIDWGRLATTFSLFQIERPSAFVSGGTYGVNGEQRNRGAEFAVFGELARDVRLLGGLTLMQAKQTKTADGTYDGKDAVAVARLQTNLGIDWDNSLLPGLGLNARVIHTGKQYADQANLLRLPSWTRLDVGARYRTKLGDKPVTLRANIENLFDRNYWASSNEGYLYLGAPRTLLISGSVDF